MWGLTGRVAKRIQTYACLFIAETKIRLDPVLWKIFFHR